MRVLWQLCAAIALAGAVTLGAAQDTVAGSDPEPATAAVPEQRPEAQAADPDVVEEVLVQGQRMGELEFDIRAYVQSFVGEIVALPPGGGHARWYDGPCVRVSNLEPTAAQYVVDRIAALTIDVGLEPGEADCRPNVLIFFTIHPDETAAHLVETEPLLFRPGGAVCCMQLGLDALDEFVRSDKPVRWWHLSMPIDVNTGLRAVPMPQDDEYPIISVFGPSRLHSGIADKMWRVIIIVDGAQLRGINWQELGDYLAVISLAQVNPNANPANFDSILNLFASPGSYSGLTEWDRSYVQALYEIDMERLTGLQQNLLVDRMLTRERAEIVE
jgi:hypothetical protein